FFFEWNAFDQREMTVSLSFLIKPNDDPAAFALDSSLCSSHFFTTRTLDAVEDVSTSAVRVDAAENILAVFDSTHHYRDRLLLSIVIKDLSERSEFGFEFASRETFDHFGEFVRNQLSACS